MAERGRPKGPDKQSVIVRIEGRLLQVVETLSKAELRSRNTQIEVLLREALARRGLWPGRSIRRDAEDDE